MMAVYRAHYRRQRGGPLEDGLGVVCGGVRRCAANGRRCQDTQLVALLLETCRSSAAERLWQVLAHSTEGGAGTELAGKGPCKPGIESLTVWIRSGTTATDWAMGGEVGTTGEGGGPGVGPAAGPPDSAQR